MILAFLVFAFFGLARAWADDSFTWAFFADVNGSLVPLSGETFELFNKKLMVFSYSETSPAPAEFLLEKEHYAATSYEIKRRIAGFVRGYLTFGYGLRNTYLEFDVNQKVVNYPFYSCMDPHEHVNAIRYDIDPHEDCAPVDIYFYHYNRKTGAAVKHYVPEVKKGCEPTPGVVLPWRCYDFHPEPGLNDPNPEDEALIVEPEITLKLMHSTKSKSLTTSSFLEGELRNGSLSLLLPSLAQISDRNTSTEYTGVPTSVERETEWYDSANATMVTSLMLDKPIGPEFKEALVSGSDRSILPASVPPESNRSGQPDSVPTYSNYTGSALSLSLIVPQNSTVHANASQRSRPASSTLEAHEAFMPAESIWLTSTGFTSSFASSNPDDCSDPSGLPLSALFYCGLSDSFVLEHTMPGEPTMTLGATCHSNNWVLKGALPPVLPCSVGTNTLDKGNQSSRSFNYLNKGSNSAEFDATTTLKTTVQCVGCEARSVVYLWNTYTDYTTSCSQETTLTITRCDSLCSPFTMTVTHATVLTVTGVCVVPETTEVAIPDGPIKSLKHEFNGIEAFEPSKNSPGQVPSPSSSPFTPSQGGDNRPNMVYTAPASTPDALGQTSQYGSDTKPIPTGRETITPITNAAAKKGNAVWLLVLAAWL